MSLSKRNIALDWYRSSVSYKRQTLAEADLQVLRYAPAYKRAGRKRNENRVNEAWIMLDTETSKKQPNEYDVHGKPIAVENHVVLYTISIRIAHQNIMTVYGRTPSEAVKACQAIHEALPGEETIFFVHNLSWDWVFLRKFFIAEFGIPEKQLNTRPHFPVHIQFSNGIHLRDSLIIAQRKLERWADDLDVQHKKATGSWDYDKLRNQDTPITEEELHYAEFDTLAGVECLDTLATMLHKKVYSMPYTATGIVREACRKKGKPNHAHDNFVRQALTFDEYLQLLNVFHGGYTHGARDYVDQTLQGNIEAYDFTSSYPYCMLAEKFPSEKFIEADDGLTIETILKKQDDYAFYFEFMAYDVRLKDLGEQMPILQHSKCLHTVNAIADNGRILKAAFVDIWLTEQDLAIIAEQYQFDTYALHNVHCAVKDYLPRWFTDFVYQCFIDKTTLKGGDKVLYDLAKGRLNSLYGMTVQKPLQDNIIEDYETGEHFTQPDIDAVAYEKYVKRYTSILPYQWGVWVTSFALRHLFQLAACCDHWVYSDTDSCYGWDWDQEKLDRLNQEAMDKLAANGYSPVRHNGKDYCPGVAELDGQYTEFRFQGAKRYACRDTKGELKITVAGVPKVGVDCLKDNIDNFKPGLVFSAATTGKRTHAYQFIESIYIDEQGNETGDSIDLMPCTYVLDTIEQHAFDMLMEEEVSVIGIL